MNATTERKANGWAPVVEFDNGSREVCRARYQDREVAISHAGELLKAYHRRPDLAPRIKENHRLER